jgi:chromosomal replication initiator protein
VGLGKTHLLQAVGNAILQEKPMTRVLYVSSEKFMNDFVESIRDRTTPKFKKYYREVDVLIIDDVQLLAGKAKTQEELFHTFNALHGQGRQVILSSDRQPKAIPTLEERLSSRLAGGMIADIKQPDFETRLAIITEKAQQSDVEIDENALVFIAKNIQRNVRELEGALNRVLGHCEFNKQRATVDYTKTILEGILEKPPQRTADVSQILHAVSTYYNLPLSDLCGKCRKQEIVRPRQVAMYLLRKENNVSFPSIGNHFGGRDHTTAMHACEKIEKLLGHDQELVEEINFIKERIYA